MNKKKDEVQFDEDQEAQNNQTSQTDSDAEPELLPKDEAQADRESGDLQSELEAARAEAAENLDKFMRAKAETENIRRRAETDIANARKFAIEKFAAEVLTIRESLELARSMELKKDSQEALDKMHEGLDLTLKQFDSTFEKFQMEMVSPEGEKFNPDLHQAISMIESPEVEANHVVSVVQKGCTISDRLLRPALVVVSNGQGSGKNSKKDENGEESEENEANSS